MNKKVTIISSRYNAFDIGLREILTYKDLFLLLVRRNFVSFYKQTVLGPLWYLLQPLLMTAVYSVVFGIIAKVSTMGIPRILFYLSGVVFWQYFSDCFSKTANVFIVNQGVFGKVYFPRLIVPLATIASSFLKFLIQMGIFILVLLYYINQGVCFPVIEILLFPFLLFVLIALALGLGLFLSAVTVKYRDLSFLLGFGLQLLFFSTPILYPFKIIPVSLRDIIWFNPLVHLIESFRYIFTGYGELNYIGLSYSSGFAFISLFIGILLFSRTEKDFLDRV